MSRSSVPRLARLAARQRPDGALSHRPPLTRLHQRSRTTSSAPTPRRRSRPDPGRCHEPGRAAESTGPGGRSRPSTGSPRSSDRRCRRPHTRGTVRRSATTRRGYQLPRAAPTRSVRSGHRSTRASLLPLCPGPSALSPSRNVTARSDDHSQAPSVRRYAKRRLSCGHRSRGGRMWLWASALIRAHGSSLRVKSPPKRMRLHVSNLGPGSHDVASFRLRCEPRFGKVQERVVEVVGICEDLIGQLRIFQPL